MMGRVVVPKVQMALPLIATVLPHQVIRMQQVFSQGMGAVLILPRPLLVALAVLVVEPEREQDGQERDVAVVALLLQERQERREQERVLELAWEQVALELDDGRVEGQALVRLMELVDYRVVSGAEQVQSLAVLLVVFQAACQEERVLLREDRPLRGEQQREAIYHPVPAQLRPRRGKQLMGMIQTVVRVAAQQAWGVAPAQDKGGLHRTVLGQVQRELLREGPLVNRVVPEDNHNNLKPSWIGLVRLRDGGTLNLVVLKMVNRAVSPVAWVHSTWVDGDKLFLSHLQLLTLP